MATNDLISENQASSFAGVSTLTLGRFAEAGYLKVETNNSGEKLYSQNELCDLFGLKKEIIIERSDNNESSEHDISYYEDLSAKDSSEASQPEGYWAETLEPDTAEPDKITETDKVIAQEKVESSSDSQDLTKMQVVIEMQEKLLELRDREISELRKERDWLKQRIERFEEKSDRDQLLLLTETQMIRKLINMNNQKKPSFWRGAMEWLGLMPPNNNANPQLPSHITEVKPRISDR